MIRIQYEIVYLETEKLRDYSIKDPVKIEEQCNLIRSFIEACGWKACEFSTRMMNHTIPILGWNPKDEKAN